MTSNTISQRILVVLPNPIGDAILATPALRQLRTNLPQAHITFLANPTVKAILTPNRWADQILTPAELGLSPRQALPLVRRLRKMNFDAAIILPNSFRSALQVFLARVTCRIGYQRDGRAALLTHPIKPFRLDHCYAPISMLDYYSYLTHHALAILHNRPPQPFQPSPDQHRLELFTDPTDQAVVDVLYQKWQLQPDQPTIILVPGGAFGGSKWWPAERFAQLADHLSSKYHAQCLLSCAPNGTERRIADQIINQTQHPPINLLDENLSLATLKELYRCARLVVSNDTGPCHITAAFNTPLITLFGPTDPRWTATGYPHEIRIRHDVDCGPCQQQICPRDHRCMNQISLAEVLVATEKKLTAQPTDAADDATLPLYRQTAQQLAASDYQPYNEQFIPLPDGTGLVHDAFQNLLKQNQLATLNDVFNYQKGQRLHKPGLGSRERFRLQLPLTPSSTDTAQVVQQSNSETPPTFNCYLKRYGRPSLKEKLKRLLTRRSCAGTALYDFAASVTLAQLGINVPRPIAFGQQPGRLGEQRSFVIIEELPHADALERLLPDWKNAQNRYTLLRDKKRLITQIADLIRPMHQAGYFHRDLYLAHIFLTRDRFNHEKLALIDLQRVFHPQCRHRRWQVKDLAQLHYSAQFFFTRTDMLRFLHAYFSCEKLTLAHKKLIRDIARKTQRIARHDQKRQTRYNLTKTAHQKTQPTSFGG